MATPLPGADVFKQLSDNTVESLGILVDANQQVLQQLVDLSTATTSESLRVYGDIQASALDAVKAGQGYVLTQQSRVQSLPSDPFTVIQKGVLDGVEGVQHAFKLFESSTGTVMKAAERVQETAQQASRQLQQTFEVTADKLKALSGTPVKVGRPGAKK